MLHFGLQPPGNGGGNGGGPGNGNGNDPCLKPNPPPSCNNVPIDEDKIEEEIWKLYNKWKSGNLQYGCNSEEVNQFKRRTNALKMAEIIKKELQKK